MPWRPLPRIAFGICIYPFQPSQPADLPLEVGDELYIIEQGGKDGAWYRGYLVAPPSLLAGLTSVKGQTLEARVFSGIFPRCCVEIRELLGEERMRGHQDGQKSNAPTISGESQTNGVLTPARSPSPVAGAVKNEKAPAIPISRSRPGSVKLNRSSRATLRSDGADLSEAPAVPPLPISPMSETRDPLAAKPPAPVPMLKIGDETPTSAQEPLVDEIASCLREWHSTKLHELLLARKYSTLDKMSSLVQSLDTARRQLLHKVLTDQELIELRENTVWDLVTGNKILSGEVIVRNPQQRGRILTADDSPVELVRLQSMMSLLDEKPVTAVDEHVVHHMLLEVPHPVGELMSPKTLAVYLAVKKPGAPLRPVSEVHAINLSAATGAAQENHMRTLFTNLGAADLGEGAGAGSQLFLIAKVIVNEALRSPIAQTHNPATVQGGTTSTREGPFNVTNIGSIRKGRASLMWPQSKDKSRTDASTIATDPARNTPVDGRQSSLEKPSKDMTRAEQSARPSTRDKKTVKRTVAAGVLRVDQLIKNSHELELEMSLWTPSQFPYGDDAGESDGNYDPLVPELLKSTSGEFRKYSFPKPFKVFLKGFAGPDPDAIIKSTPTLLQNIGQTRRIGFAGAPNKSRSDIYFTINEASLPRHAFLAHPKAQTVPLGTQQGLANLQLTLEVRRASGQRIENCIFPSCNSQGHTAWRTTACERGEPWNLTIRLAVPPEDVPGAHVVMSIADLPGFPFALCWIPLWDNGAFVQDGEHVLNLYHYDEITSSIVAGKGAYLQLPWQATGRQQDSLAGPMAHLRMTSNLCSTEFSQDSNMLSLLNWRQQPTAELPAVLRRFLFVPEIEVVKQLDETLDALFSILVDSAGNVEYENLVFDALIFVLSIVHDRRFKLAPLVDEYAASRFNYPSAGGCLVRSFSRLLIDPADPQNSRKLRAVFKVGAHVFKFICIAQAQIEKTEAARRSSSQRSAFLREIKEVFRSLERVMQDPSAILVGTKTILVQNFDSWLREMPAVLTPRSILDLTIGFVDSCADVQGKLVLYKLIMIEHLSHLDAFRIPETKQQLLANTVRWLSPYWGKTEIVTEQWKEQVRLCCSVVASQIDDLGVEACNYLPKLVDSYRAIQLAPRQPKKTLSLLFPTSYPFPTKVISKASTDFDEALVEIAAVLSAVTSLPFAIHIEMEKSELAEFLFGALQVYISVLNGDAYPHAWLSVHIYQHRSIMKSLEKLSNILVESFLPHPDEADQFNTELWRAFLDALLKLVSSGDLALETFPEQKRRAVWKIAGDVRELGADLLRRSWEAIGWETGPDDKAQYGLEKLGGYQVQYVPGLVAPIVELCLSVHEGLRSVAIQVLQTMIISEWTLTADLGLIQAEIIDCLDSLFKQKVVSESVLQKLFIGELVDLFEPLTSDPEDPLLRAVKNLVATVDELLDLLVAVHSAESSGEAFQIMDTLHLMEFLKDMHKEEIFVRYVHQLAKIQTDARNFTEAGLALRLHADLYAWDPITNLEELKEPGFPAQTAFDRKEQLYFQMIRDYEEAQSWDNALGCYMELADQYEQNIFDFVKLARTQRAMATIYETIAKGHRDTPRYFRVSYKGFGFPISLRDKQFIFQGQPLDRMSSFIDRLQAQHPAASIHTSGSVDEEVEGQYIYVYPVSPQKDLNHPIYQRLRVAQSVRDYYLLSRPNIFVSSTRRKPSEAGLKDQSLEKTLYHTADPFPTILRRSEILEVSVITRTPLEQAIERTTRKTVELGSLEQKVAAGDDVAFAGMIDAISASVNPESTSSIANYRDFLNTATSQAGNESEEELDEDIDAASKPIDPLQNALRIALIDYAIAVNRSLAHLTRPAHQATRVELTQRKQAFTQA